MVRSAYKQLYCHKKILALAAFLRLRNTPFLKDFSVEKKKKIRKARRVLQNYNIKVYKKASTIIRSFLNNKTFVHDGLYFQAVTITAQMVDFRLKFGQFVFTKRLGAFIHKNNKIAKKKAKLLRQIAAKASIRKKKKKAKKK